MKILTYSCYYTPEIAASMYLTEDLLEGMVNAGHFVEMYVPTPCRGISDEVRKEYKKKKTEVRYNGHLIVHRFALYKEGKNTFFRALRYAFLTIAFLWKGLTTKYDVMFAQSTPPTQGMMAGLVSAIKRKPFVYNLQDIFPDSLANTGITHKGSIVWKIGRAIEDFSYNHADRIIVISEDFKKNIMVKGVSENKIVVVPNWADIKGVRPINRAENKLIQKFGIKPDDYLITYCGNIGYTQNMDMLLDVAKKIKICMPRVKFVLIGDGAEKVHVEKRVHEEEISNVILIPFQPYEDISHVFSLGDVGLIISKPGIGNNSVPSKTWSIMAAQRPILASFDKESALCKLIDSIGCGVCTEAGNQEDLIEGISKMMHIHNNELGLLGSKYVQATLSKDKCVRQYIEIIENTAGEK